MFQKLYILSVNITAPCDISQKGLKKVGYLAVSGDLFNFSQFFPTFTDFAYILFVSSCFGVIVQDTEHCNRLLRAQIQENQHDINALHVCLSIRSFFSSPP